jgi:hypothetical protein
MRNFEDIYHLATQEEKDKGLVWYDEAHTFAEGLAAKYDLKVDQVTGIIAALSPRCPWSSNCKQAKEFIRTKGKTEVTTYSNNKKKARAILKGSDPLEVLHPTRPDRVTKTLSFYKNILDPESSDDVTIDTLMIRAYFNDPSYPEKKAFNNGSVLRQIASDLKALAQEYGLKAHQMQAIIWQVWKRITDTKPFSNEVNYETLLS